MMGSRTVAIVLGTRPEAIKLAPVILECQKPGSDLHALVCVTGQHREMLDPILEWFRIKPDYKLDLMQANQGLAELSARALTAIHDLLSNIKPGAVMIQGDTTTAAFAGLAAFYRRIPVCHVEAGLRTNDIYNPFPEEVNRRLASVVASLHFAPTAAAANALISEGIPPSSVFTVGNTVVDALRLTRMREHELSETDTDAPWPSDGRRLLLVTAHRRESFGEPIEHLCGAIRSIAERNKDIEIAYPVHLNPNVREPVYRMLGGLERVHLLEPLSYQQFVRLMAHSYLILTDSGGIQEEATVLGKPTLVMRNATERGEAVKGGTAILVGMDRDRIVSAAEKLLTDNAEYARMSARDCPFGDGYAARKIVEVLQARLGSE